MVSPIGRRSHRPAKVSNRGTTAGAIMLRQQVVPDSRSGNLLTAGEETAPSRPELEPGANPDRREKMRPSPLRGADMNESISSPFIRYPIGTSLLMAGILFVGIVAYPLLPVAPLPQVDFPTIQVSASLPGAQPGNHGVLGGAAAGAPARANSRHRADDFDELARLDRRSPSSSISTATSTAPPTTSRRRSTPPAASCRRTCRRRRPIARSTRPTRRCCCCRRPRTRCR